MTWQRTLAVLSLPLLTCTGCNLTFSGSHYRGPSVDNYPHQASTVRTFDLELGSNESVRLSSPFGAVHVETGDGPPRAEAAVTVFAKRRIDADAGLEAIAVRVSRDTGTLDLRVDDDALPDDTRARVTFRVTLPPGHPISAATSSGDIHLAGPFASVAAESGYGDIDVTGSHGRTRLETSSGSITLRESKATELRAKSGYGSVVLQDVEAERIDARSESGDVRLVDVAASTELVADSGYGKIHLENIRGNATARTGSGDVILASSAEARYDLTSGYGKIRVTRASGTLRASSDSGAVTVADFAGSVAARSGYGKVAVAGTFQAVDASSDSGTVVVDAAAGSTCGADWRLHSGYGNVDVRLPDDFSAELHAKTQYGRIHTERPVLMTDSRLGSRTVLVGRLGGGGNALHIDTESGTIQIR